MLKKLNLKLVLGIVLPVQSLLSSLAFAEGEPGSSNQQGQGVDFTRVLPPEIVELIFAQVGEESIKDLASLEETSYFCKDLIKNTTLRELFWGRYKLWQLEKKLGELKSVEELQDTDKENTKKVLNHASLVKIYGEYMDLMGLDEEDGWNEDRLPEAVIARLGKPCEAFYRALMNKVMVVLNKGHDPIDSSRIDSQILISGDKLPFFVYKEILDFADHYLEEDLTNLRSDANAILYPILYNIGSALPGELINDFIRIHRKFCSKVTINNSNFWELGGLVNNKLGWASIKKCFECIFPEGDVPLINDGTSTIIIQLAKRADIDEETLKAIYDKTIDRSPNLGHANRLQILNALTSGPNMLRLGDSLFRECKLLHTTSSMDERHTHSDNGLWGFAQNSATSQEKLKEIFELTKESKCLLCQLWLMQMLLTNQNLTSDMVNGIWKIVNPLYKKDEVSSEDKPTGDVEKAEHDLALFHILLNLSQHPRVSDQTIKEVFAILKTSINSGTQASQLVCSILYNRRSEVDPDRLQVVWDAGLEGLSPDAQHDVFYCCTRSPEVSKYLAEGLYEKSKVLYTESELARESGHLRGGLDFLAFYRDTPIETLKEILELAKSSKCQDCPFYLMCSLCANENVSPEIIEAIWEWTKERCNTTQDETYSTLFSLVRNEKTSLNILKDIFESAQKWIKDSGLCMDLMLELKEREGLPEDFRREVNLYYNKVLDEENEAQKSSSLKSDKGDKGDESDNDYEGDPTNFG